MKNIYKILKIVVEFMKVRNKHGKICRVCLLLLEKFNLKERQNSGLKIQLAFSLAFRLTY